MRNLAGLDETRLRAGWPGLVLLILLYQDSVLQQAAVHVSQLACLVQISKTANCRMLLQLQPKLLRICGTPNSYMF